LRSGSPEAGGDLRSGPPGAGGGLRSGPPGAGGDLRSAASAGAAALAGRYLFVGLMNLGATTLLVRHLGPAKWASYGVALFLANFMDQYLGSKLLGAIIASPDEPSDGLLRSGAYVMQVVGRAGLLVAVVAMAPVAGLTQLHAPVLMCAASGICGYVYVSRALPAARMERRLEYRLIGLGEVIDQVTFTVLAVALVLGGLGLPGVMLALAVQGLPTLVLWRRHTRPTPFLGRRGDDDVAAIVCHRPATTKRRTQRHLGVSGSWERPDPPNRARPDSSDASGRLSASHLRFALPGSGVAACVLIEGVVPIVAFSFAHARLLGLAITSSSILAYPGVAVLVLQRIAFPAFARAGRGAVNGDIDRDEERGGERDAGRGGVENGDFERLTAGVEEVASAAAAILIATEGLVGVTCPWWLPWLLGARWHGAWPLTAAYAACYVLLGQINVITGGLMAAGRPRAALRTWLAMTLPWVLGAALWMAFCSPVWLVCVLIGGRVIGFGVGWEELRLAGVAARLGGVVVRCGLAAGAIVGGAAAAANGRTGWVLAAGGVLVVVELSALWASRGTLRSVSARAVLSRRSRCDVRR
jgi:hypothetical protein